MGIYIHARCVGISDVLYDDIRSCELPWMCYKCSKEAAKALQELPSLNEKDQLLSAENTGLKGEPVEVRALVATMHSALTSLETKVTSVSVAVDLLQSTPSPVHEEQQTGGNWLQVDRGHGRRIQGRQSDRYCNSQTSGAAKIEVNLEIKMSHHNKY